MVKIMVHSAIISTFNDYYEFVYSCCFDKELKVSGVVYVQICDGIWDVKAI